MMSLRVIRTLHFIFLGILIAFIVFYFMEYLPFKTQKVCAESSANKVLNLSPHNAYEVYHQLYKTCLSKK